ncbi:MAG TPA: ATP-dependent sacrificial sulfur transferase LarE [Beutenbergiaceae bacterium]|nr:ATP-dependent sacrificial sulfur transferase LarE [Beutenbergiaceae bacterium]
MTHVAELAVFDANRELPAALAGRAQRFSELLADHQRVAVAFSGGVDSSLVLALAARAKGHDQVVAVLGVSPSLADRERQEAHRVAEVIGVQLVEVYPQEMSDPRYVANDGLRCYFCKFELYSRTMMDAVTANAADALLNGDTADDIVDPDRPGRKAAEELGVLSPLAGAGIDKPAVREFARELGLPVWDKPSSPCLASRIPRAVPVTIGRLREVEKAEDGLRDLGFRELRVRHRAEGAVVQLGQVELDQARAAEVATKVEQVVLAAGFKTVRLSSEPLLRD